MENTQCRVNLFQKSPKYHSINKSKYDTFVLVGRQSNVNAAKFYELVLDLTLRIIILTVLIIVLLNSDDDDIDADEARIIVSILRKSEYKFCVSRVVTKSGKQ